MAAKGAKYKWRDGKILHSSYLWKAPSKRRLPRILIEDRALEVGIIIALEEPWMVFEESNHSTKDIDKTDATQLEFYLNRYYLLPKKFKNKDTYEWLKNPDHKLLLWGEGQKYYIKSLI